MTFKALNDLALAQSLWPYIFTHPHIHLITLATPKLLAILLKGHPFLGPHVFIYVLLSSSLEAPYSLLQPAYPYFSQIQHRNHMLQKVFLHLLSSLPDQVKVPFLCALHSILSIPLFILSCLLSLILLFSLYHQNVVSRSGTVTSLFESGNLQDNIQNNNFLTN